MKNPPSIEEFMEYGAEILTRIGDEPRYYTEWVQLKYMAWESNDWQKTVKGKDIPIKNWKTTLLQCIPYRERNKSRSIKVNEPITVTQMLRQKHGIS